MISEHFNKDNPHHAYLIEGAYAEVVPEILKFCQEIGISTAGNPDFCQLFMDNMKMEEALSLRAMSSDRGFASGDSGKKIFLVCASNATLDAQNVLLKMFEEPIANTHFFLVVPDTNALLKTLVSRFYLIKGGSGGTMAEEAERFIQMPLSGRLDFIKELLAETKGEEDDLEFEPLDLARDKPTGGSSPRSKALNFLNALESVLHNKYFGRQKEFQKNSPRATPPLAWTLPGNNFSETPFAHILKVREFLRMPGSSTKSLMESVALIVPKL